MKQLLIVLLFTALFSAASAQKQIKLYSDIYDKAIPIKGNIVNKTELASPRYLQVIDSLLLIQHTQGDFFYEIINIKTGMSVNKFGRKGRGPGEVLYSNYCGLEWNNKRFWLHDVVGNKIHFYDSQKIIAGKRDAYIKSYQIDSTQLSDAIQWNNHSLISTPLYDKNQNRHFIIRNIEDGQIIKYCGKYPELEQGLPTKFKEDVFHTWIAHHPKNKFFVTSQKFWDHITVYDTLFNKKVIIDGPFYVKLQYEEDQYSTTVMTHGLISEGACCGPNGFMIAITEKQRFKFPFYQYLLWFNYEGELIKVFKFDHKVSWFTVDWNRMVVYATVILEEEPTIYSYQL